MINCASTYTAVALRPGHRRNRALGPASLKRGPARARWALSLGRRRRAGCALASDGGRQRPLISAKSNPPSDRRSRKRVRQRRRRNVPLLNGDRASGLCDRRRLMALTIGGSSLTSRAHGAPIYTADDDHAGCRRRRGGLRGSRSASSRLCAPSLSSATCVASSSSMASGTPWGYRRAATESHGRPTSPTTVTTSTASRSACFWSRLLRRSQRRAGAGRLCNEPMTSRSQRDGWAGWAAMVVRSGWAACPTLAVPALVAFALSNLGVRST